MIKENSDTGLAGMKLCTYKGSGRCKMEEVDLWKYNKYWPDDGLQEKLEEFIFCVGGSDGKSFRDSTLLLVKVKATWI